jgi:hypothetical protein
VTGRGRAKPLAVALLFAAASPAAARAQAPPPVRASAAVVPQTITVGDIFQAAIRVAAPPGTEVVFPDSLVLPADVESAGRREIRVDTVRGEPQVTAIYPLTGWRPGDVPLAPAGLTVRDTTGVHAVEVAFPAFTLSSVLPADTTGIEPKPAKDVLGANRVWWPILLGAGLLLAALAALYVWYRRRRPREAATAVPDVPPRARALARLDAARSAGLMESGRTKEFYSEVTDAVREYLEALDVRWGRDLTTSELAGRLRGNGVDAQAGALLALLGSADLVKFAQRRPLSAEAAADWTSARRFVESFDWPLPVAAVPEEAKAA